MAGTRWLNGLLGPKSVVDNAGAGVRVGELAAVGVLTGGMVAVGVFTGV